VRPRTRTALGLGCLATIAAADVTLHRRKPRWIMIGLFDHPAHFATGALVALNVRGRPKRWTKACLVGSLIADVDHIPLALRPKHPTSEDPRPVSHCLLAVAPVAAAAGITQSERLHGLATGMLAHYLRDLGVGSGVPLLWPGTRRSLKAPYAAYLAACAALAFRAGGNFASLDRGL
jgi:LexA-binding, inner membrane-associated putative hydrolase